MSRSVVEVVHVGSAARDIAADDPRGWRLGGGVTYAALTTARLGLATAAVIGVDGPARDADELDRLRAAGVDLLLVPLDEGPVFHNVETPTGRRQTCLAVGRPLEPLHLPASWQRARSWSFTPVADEVPDAWAAVPDDEAVVAVGWQGLLRTLVDGAAVTRRAPADRAMLRRADLVGVSHHDVEPTTTLDALASHLHTGARLLVTQGHLGGLLVTVGADGPTTSLRYLPTRTDRETDATGAGDTFLGALVAATIRPSIMGLMRRRSGADLRFAAAAGSLAVEDVGLAGVPDLMAVRGRAVRERVRRLVVPSELAQVTVETAFDA
jgi:sugar/nucleoside kinase (ribokinase family)